MGPIALAILALSTFAHFTFAGWVLRSFPHISRKLVYAMATALSLWSMIARILVKTYPSQFLSEVFAATMIETSILALSAVPLAILRAISYVTSRRTSDPIAASLPKNVNVVEQTVPPSDEHAAPRSPEVSQPLASRRIFLERATGAVAYGATAGLFGWGMVRGRHAFQIDELVVRVPNLPKALEGYTFAQISDIHVGPFVRERELNEGFDLIRQIKPDALLMTGDLVDSDPSFAAMLAAQLQRVPTRDGIFGILGNHDHFAGAEHVRSTLSRAGINMLVNQHRVIRQSEGGIALVGLDDLVGQRFGGQGYRLDRAVANLDPELPRIILSHQPGTVDRLVSGRNVLQLSGHTHGGQINVGFNPAGLVYEYVKGRYQVGDTTLYVNRGFGTAGPPARLGAPPEVTRIVLVGA